MKPLAHQPPPNSENSFSKTDLERCADGLLFGPGNAQLPAAPLLMLDRIVDIQESGGKYSRGYAIAELDIDSSKWFFKSHFIDDPIMPGCLLIEALWQLAGFHLAWSGYGGKGRVLESGKTRFLSAVNEVDQILTISIQIRKILVSENPIYIVDGSVSNPTGYICESQALKVGLF